MTISTLARTAVLSTLVWSGLTAGHLMAGEIRDTAQIFLPATVTDVTARLRSVREKTGLEVTVETFAKPPADRLARIQTATSSSAKDKVYTEWLIERAQTLQAKGVFVLISQNPGHLQVWFDRQTQARGATKADRDRLRVALLDSFRKREFDAGLTALTGEVETLSTSLKPASAVKTMIAEHKAPPRNGDVAPAGNRFAPQRNQAAGGAGMGSIFWWIVGGVVLLVVFSFIGRLIRGITGGGGGYGQQPGYGGGGGGFMGNMMGGLFGAVAGNWIYNSFFGGHHGNTFGGTDHTSSMGGNDFGGGGGGDFGGGDFGGGGDWGGGDFGGDSGGGGDF